jgi:hypothetical protein
MLLWPNNFIRYLYVLYIYLNATEIICLTHCYTSIVYSPGSKELVCNNWTSSPVTHEDTKNRFGNGAPCSVRLPYLAASVEHMRFVSPVLLHCYNPLKSHKRLKAEFENVSVNERWGVGGERFSIAGWSTMLQAGRSRVRDPMRSLTFFNLPNPSSDTGPCIWLSL